MTVNIYQPLENTILLSLAFMMAVCCQCVLCMWSFLSVYSYDLCQSWHFAHRHKCLVLDFLLFIFLSWCCAWSSGFIFFVHSGRFIVITASDITFPSFFLFFPSGPLVKLRLDSVFYITWSLWRIFYLFISQIYLLLLVHQFSLVALNTV